MLPRSWLIQYRRLTMIVDHCRSVPTPWVEKYPVASHRTVARSAGTASKDIWTSNHLRPLPSRRRRRTTLAWTRSSRVTRNGLISDILITVEQKALAPIVIRQRTSTRNPNPCRNALSVVHPVNHPFQEVLWYRTYHLPDESSHYGDEVAWSIAWWAKCLQVQMRSQILDFFDRISILSFLFAFKLAFDLNGVHKGAVIWLLNGFKNCFAAVTLSTRTVLKSKQCKPRKAAQ